jgi:hypothetical protein
MKTTILAVLMVAVSSVFAGYVIEWSAALNYSMATGYTANKAFSYDITGDSVPELFVMDSSALKVYSGVTHSLIWTIPTAPYSYMTYPVVANTDGDANKELVFAGYRLGASYVYYGKFLIYDAQTHALEFGCPEKIGFPSVSVADIDGDNKSEICIVSGDAGNRILEVYGSTDAGTDEGYSPRGLAPGPGSGFVLPNPGRAPVQLQIRFPRADAVAITDLTGRVLRMLPVTKGSKPVSVPWDCCDDAGRSVPAGTYLFRCGECRGEVKLVR